MKILFLLGAIALTGCTSMGSGLLDRTQICDVSHKKGGHIEAVMKDGALIQDYPEQSYFVYTISGSSSARQSPVLSGGKASMNGVDYVRGFKSFTIGNQDSGNMLEIHNCRKAY